ncbi:MAG: response regulator [Verrucomicrobiota bacterium]
MPIRVYLIESCTLLGAGLRASLLGMPNVALIGSTPDPDQAPGEIRTHQPDVIVVDESIDWPELEVLIRQGAALSGRPRVIVVSGTPDGAGAFRALQAGAAGYLPSSTDGATLSQAIATVAAGEFAFGPDQLKQILGPFRKNPEGERDPVASLTGREREVFRLTGRGFEAKEIGRKLEISARTVDVHRANIRNKLGITGMHELMRYAMHWEENERLAAQMQEFCGERRPLLLVEDDEVDVLSVKRALKELRAETPMVVTSNGEEALEHLRSKTGLRPFLIVLDINLPRMNGAEFLKELRQDPSLASVPVVVLTSSPHEADKERIYSLGVTGYFVKPTTSREFLQLFRTLAQYWGTNARPGIPSAAAA